MNLFLKALPSAVIPGGVAYQLVDDDDVALPNQRAASIVQEVDDVTVVTVSFLVDGDRVAIVPNAGDDEKPEGVVDVESRRRRGDRIEVTLDGNTLSDVVQADAQAGWVVVRRRTASGAFATGPDGHMVYDKLEGDVRMQGLDDA